MVENLTERVTFRLDATTRRSIERLADVAMTSMGEIVREAIAMYLRRKIARQK